METEKKTPELKEDVTSFPGKNGPTDPSHALIHLVDQKTIDNIIEEYLDLLDTSAAVFDLNGQYLGSRVSSGWCQLLNDTSRESCKTSDEQLAMQSGKWHCHESCWKSSKRSMQKGQAVDMGCSGGIHLYAEPIWVKGAIVGSVNFGYGDPPVKPDQLELISKRYGIDVDKLSATADQYESRPPFLLDIFKKRLKVAARLMGEMITRKQTELKLEQHQNNLSALVKTRTESLSAKNEEASQSKKALVSLLEDVNGSRAELKIANKRLEELDKLKSIFISSMSHELRTPLNSILGFTGIILQGISGKINADQEDQLKRVYGSARHLLQLITEIIDLSKIEAGKLEPCVMTFSLENLMMEAISSLKNQIEEKGLCIEIDIAYDTHLKSDRTRLLQCLLNYLSNAMKFTKRGRISIFAKEVGNMLEISIKDTGTGIKEKDLSLLFKPFTRVKTSLKITPPGSGLGLYLTKKMAEEVLGGSVAVKSQFGQGSTFSLKIPIELVQGSPSQ